MKYTTLLGGLIGFGATFTMAILTAKSLNAALIQASIGSVVMGLLFRWISVIWIRNVKQMLMEKHQAAVAAMAEAEERKQQEAEAKAKAKASTPV